MRLTNEGKACDAVVTLLESETGFRREDVRPHADAGNGKNVELRLKLGDQEYAIEHTLIETFEGLTYAEKLFLEQGRNLTTNLAGKLPIPGWYYLSLPYGSWTQIKREDRIHIQQTQNKWVCVKAHELYCKNPGRPTRSESERGYTDSVTETHAGVPFAITLKRASDWAQPAKYDGTLFVRPSVAINLRAELRSRIARALQGKCPKLQSCKSSGAISVLILETRDSASNHWQLAEEFVAELSNRSDTPDYVFLVDTLTTRWFVLPLKMRSELIPDTAAIKFNPNELTDVTSGRRFLVR